MDKLKRYKEIIVIAVMVLAFGSWLNAIDTKATYASNAVDKLAENQSLLTAIVASNDTKLSVYLEIMGFDKDKAMEWATMPRTTPLDSLGKPIPDAPWIVVSDDLKSGVMLKVNDSLEVQVDTLWNFKETK